jgi:hypothetical protein
MSEKRYRAVFMTRLMKARNPELKPYWIIVKAENETAAQLAAHNDMRIANGTVFRRVGDLVWMEQVGVPNSTHLTTTPVSARRFLAKRGRLQRQGVPMEPLAVGTNIFEQHREE